MSPGVAAPILAAAVPPRRSVAATARRLAPLAWPVWVGQVAVLAFGTVDTIFIARVGALDLAALAVGSAAYISVFIGLMGVVVAVGPIAGRLYGAGQQAQAGAQLGQAGWLALLLSVLGCTLLAFPQPFLALAQAPPTVAAKVQAYTGALAFALPSALLFAAFRGFNIAVSRPKAVMALQLGGLALKVPLTALLIHGMALPAALGGGALPAFGVAGCGIATAVVMGMQALAAWMLLRRDPFYAPFGWQRGTQAPSALGRPDPKALAGLLRLGVPMGLSIAVEVTGFTFMAFFISRLGPGAVAGHQIAANLAGLLFMVPMALANATSTLVAQRLGAGDAADARRLARHGLAVGVTLAALLGATLAAARGTVVGLYTTDAAIAAVALPLVAWVGLFHVFDAAQTVAAFVLRAWHVATLPFVIYAASVWGVGLGGGYLLVFVAGDHAPAWLQGAAGFWAAGTAGLLLAAAGLIVLLVLRLRAIGLPPKPAADA